VDSLVTLYPCPSTEEVDRLRLRERKHWILDLAPNAQELTARDEQREVRAGLDERGELGRRLDHVLDLVQEQKQLAFSDVVGQTIPGAERLGDRLGDESRLSKWSKANPEDTRFEVRQELGRHLERQTSLARTARAGEAE
jgi:hypothetical protein